ncbi:HAD family hydrolase [Sphingomonas jatrophae]|uniref:Putative hydrolase of the HAD superfamily n=1 Tax=Sphingomonas jatrophae TaxID=1166337 RepID=A0A1I6JUQ0_9SPHN|nr:HAD family hydrolase [Sphingomonas jatrophae]SFR82719.1 putative hydrolase of the HAD superfamily [Sphingomonas jatrophae]
MTIRFIGLDADDTLWHCETIFQDVRARFSTLLADFADAETLDDAMETIERRNLALYGYGAKGFTLSMLEAALETSGEQVPAATLARILALGREMMAHPVDPLSGVADALEELASGHRLVLITKGDLFHQEAKLAASGLGHHFTGVEIVSEKRAETYAGIFRRYDVAPEEAVMAGNSVRSDILPALDAGAWAALVPYPLVWSHEAAHAPPGHPRYRELSSLAELPGWVAEIG